jgi:uncharacterized coiled-coil protein SlyX
MIPTAIRDNHELGCACMSVPSDAAIRTPTSKNGASTPLMTAVQNSAFTGAQHLPPIRPSYKKKPYTARYEAVNAMLLNEFLKEHRKVQELEVTVAHQQKDFEATIAGLNARLKEQDSKIEKVSAQLEASKPAPQVVNNQ